MSDMQPPFEEESSMETTQVFETPFVAPEYRGKKREILYDDEGNAYLVVYKKVRTTPSRTKRFRRRPKPITRWERVELRLVDNGLVDHRLVKRFRFSPVDTEDTIYVFDRLHWWSHGPQQIGAISIAAFMTGLMLWAMQNPATTQYHTIILALWSIMMVAVTASYVAAWIPWAYRCLIVTDSRVILSYQPPFGLPGNVTSLSVSDVLDLGTVDQAAAKYLPSLGNLLPKFGIMGYKILKGESAAQDDDWLRNGIPHVRDAEEVEKIIASAKAQLDAVESERHEEDMDLQSRQALGTERIVELLEQLNANRPPVT